MDLDRLGFALVGFKKAEILDLVDLGLLLVLVVLVEDGILTVLFGLAWLGVVAGRKVMGYPESNNQ